MSLEQLGWDPFFATAFAACAGPGEIAGRVARADRGRYLAFTADGEIDTETSGRFRHLAPQASGRPVAGDWVVLAAEGRRITAVLPRRTCFSRKQAGERTEEQVLASNVDVVFLVAGLDGDFNPRRLERYLLLAWESGATPVIVLNKSDACEDPQRAIADTRAVAAGASVLLLSALNDDGLGQLGACVATGQTAALLGSSGVGKSTIVNRLLGRQAQRVQPVRDSDSRGRHTTTHRELIPLPEGWLLMDTPGLRELQLWGTGDGIERVFTDIAALAEQCRFRDCRHQGEPGCAVAEAIEQGRIETDRLESYTKLQRELDYLERKQDTRAAAEQNRVWRNIHRAMRRMPDKRGGY